MLTQTMHSGSSVLHLLLPRMLPFLPPVLKTNGYQLETAIIHMNDPTAQLPFQLLTMPSPILKHFHPNLNTLTLEFRLLDLSHFKTRLTGVRGLNRTRSTVRVPVNGLDRR